MNFQGSVLFTELGGSGESFFPLGEHKGWTKMVCVKRAAGFAEAIGRPGASEPKAREPPGLRETPLS